ncbi:MAG: peptide chain release factor N(5)-glutamine methyltransferase, partial [Candidatus Saccharimonadales bacterium]
MKIEPWLKQATKELETAGIGTARLDCLVLLEGVTHKDRSWLLAHLGFKLNATHIKKLDNQVGRRAEHEPLAYIRNKTEFYGREFYIDQRVLEPRPESEAMINLLKSLNLLSNQIIIDVGTGSGALAVTT